MYFSGSVPAIATSSMTSHLGSPWDQVLDHILRPWLCLIVNAVSALSQRCRKVLIRDGARGTPNIDDNIPSTRIQSIWNDI